ncbi:tape measure protein [Limosilactobacillus reuteri]|uniref:tape measure protein n=1 Tax=Limosilactobacillus reuteri TaxID=1598 RepID=UPI00399077C3
MAKVQAKMATEVALDLVQASTAIKNLTSAVSSSTSAWKAQEAYLRSVGDSAGAARAKYTGLGEAMDAQRRKIEALQDKQRSMTSMTSESATKYLKLKKQIDATQEAMSKLDTSTEAGKAAEKSMQATIEQLTAQQSKLNVGTVDSARQYLNFGKQIDRAKAKLASMAAQQQRAAQQMAVEDSGVKKLSSSMRVQEGLVSATVERLKAQGQSYQALQTSLNGARQKLSSLTEIQRREIALLDRTKQRFGESSDQYAKQATEVQKLGTRISETRQRINELDGQLGKQPTAWNYVRNSILGVDSAEKRARDSAINFGTVLKANIFGGWIQTGFSTLTTQLKSIITNGTQAAKAGGALEARWKNIGVSAGNIKQLSEQVGDLKTNTNLTAQSVNALQTRFYGMTHSISQTKTLTQGVASLSDQLKLSDQQANAFAGGLSRVESSGKVTSSSLGRLEKQAPGLTAALSKVSGMSQESFKNLVSSGKMTTDQFNQLLAKASKDYSKNSEAFGQTSGGALHKLQQEWISTQAKLAKPLLKVSATGLNELSDALNNKQTQQGLQVLAKGLADAAVNATKFIGYIAQHQNTVKIFGGALLGLAVAFKGMQVALIAKDTISGFIKMVGKIPRLHTTKIRVNEANSAKDLQNFSRRVDRIPRSKTTTVRANTTAATNNIQKVGTTARTASITSKLSFATIGTAAKTAGTTISMAFRANPLGAVITGIQLAISAFNFLYQHSAKFRKFANGIANSAKSMASKAGRWFGNFAKTAGKHISSTVKSWQRGWRNMNRQSQKSTKQEERYHQRLAKEAQRQHTRMWASTKKEATKGWTQLNQRAARGVQQQIRQHQLMAKREQALHNKMWSTAKGAFKNGWGGLHTSTKNGVNRVNSQFDNMKLTVAKRAHEAMTNAQNHFKNGYNDIKTQSGNWRDKMSDLWGNTKDKIGSLADNIRNDSTNKFSDMHSKLNDLTNGGLGKMEDAWHGRLESIAGVITNSGKHIWQQFVDLLKTLAKPFKDLINDIIEGVNWVLDHVGGDGKLGKFEFSFGSFATGTPNGGLLHDQVALLNDGNGPHYQEMIHKASTGETFMLPAKRNIVLPLQAGDEVLDGERSHQLATTLGMPVPHANGAIGDFFSGLWNGAKELEDIAEDALKDVVGFGKSLFTHFIANVTPKSTDSLNGGLKFNLPGFFAERLKNWLKKQLDDIHSADSPAGTMSKEAFAKAARRAAQSLGQSISSGDIDHLYWQAFTESSVNPAQNGGYDDHDGTGLPIGLFQFKRSTWNAAVRAMGGKHNNIHSAVDQIAAVLADRTWRSDFPPIGVKRGWTPHGYANGGIATEPSIFGEAGAEMAIPLDTMKSTRAWQLMKQVVDYYAGSSNQSTQVVNQTDLTPLEKRFDAALAQNQQLISLIEQLIGVTDSANNPTARYRRTQRDINLAQAQSLTGI